MARTGRPPVPTEVKRKRGTDRPDRTPAVGSVVALPPAKGVPAYPADLGLAGRRFWDRAWAAAITWLSPDSDGEAIEEAARLADDVDRARQRYRATSDPADMRALVLASKQFMEVLSSLGFNPTARTRLGVAEVKRVSALEQLLERQQQRR
jgi:hypothetical protein